MRKLEKLMDDLCKDEDLSWRGDSLLLRLYNMEDSELEERLKNKTDMSNNEVVCSLCNGITYYFAELTQEEIDKFICVNCEERMYPSY